MMIRHTSLIGALLSLAACQPTMYDQSAFSSYSQPHDLVERSIQQVTVPLDGARGIDDLVAWLNQEKPINASVECASNDKLCLSAKRTLSNFSVPFASKFAQGGNQVVLTYERIAIRDCDPRYVDATYNRYNISSQNYGCANASNIARMASDKRQLTNPQLLGYMDGTHAAIAHDRSYEKPADDDSGTLLQDLAPE